jgi:exosortase
MNKTLNGSSQKGTREAGVNLQVGIFSLFTIIAGYLAYTSLSGLVNIGGLLGYGPIGRVVNVDAGANSDYYSHILLIPFVSAYFLFEERRKVLQQARYSFCWGLTVAAGGLLVYGVALWFRGWLGQNDFASLATAGSLIFWWGGFLLAFGPEAFKTAEFPLLFLLFAIPIPQILLDWFIYILQVGSTEVTEWLFQLTGTDYIRNGFFYRLPNITIEVAKECSGIRSSIALIITGVLAGHLFLRTGWRKLILIVAMIPFTIFKNGVRILTLSLLAIYVDTKFITDSWLHHTGGFVFYLPALGMLGLLVWWFRKAERRGHLTQSSQRKAGD